MPRRNLKLAKDTLLVLDAAELRSVAGGMITFEHLACHPVLENPTMLMPAGPDTDVPTFCHCP